MAKKKKRKATSPDGGRDLEAMTVYVHGIGVQPVENTWKGQWDLALFGRPMRNRTRSAYWADVLHGKDGKSSDDDSDREFNRYADWLLGTTVDPNASGVAAFCDRLGFSVARQRKTSERSSINETASLTESRRQHISDRLLKAFIRDTATYFFDADIREHIHQRLIQQLPDEHTPLVIVSHGLGTVIAYEVLAQIKLRRRNDVALFVTLGSPLGMTAIQDQLRENGVSIRFPTGIGAWHNFTNRFDPLVINDQLASDFEPKQASDNLVDRIQDHMVMEPGLWQPAELNRHDSAGYMSDTLVRETVYHALNFDSTQRFVVARDVTQGFAARDVRQPVLIEVLEPQYWACGEQDEELEEREERQGALQKTLNGRIEHLADEIRDMVRANVGRKSAKSEVEAARIQILRKYVSARLTPAEIQKVADEHAELNVYAMWRSAVKKKLIHRSHRTIGADAARQSFDSMGSGITWAVFDTGCRLSHPHFNKRRKRKKKKAKERSLIKAVLDCTTDSRYPKPINDDDASDPDGHGTHVCGIIAGQGNDELRDYKGVAPKCKLLVYKVLNDHGVGEDAWIIKAIDDIFRRNENSSGLAVHGVNLSLGGPYDATVYGCGFSPTCKELRDLWRQGVLVCVAAGNEGQIQVSTLNGPFDLNTTRSIGDPANLDDCIAVGSVNTDKPYLYGISHFSSRGPTTDGRVKPDVVAPGERIRSCNSEYERKPYRQSSGTSMACPHVSGLLAAFLSVRQEFVGRPDEVKKILLASCNSVGRDPNNQGHGIPNLMKMLTST